MTNEQQHIEISMISPRHHPFPSNSILNIKILKILAPGYPSGQSFSAQNVLYYNSGGSAWSKEGALPSVDS